MMIMCIVFACIVIIMILLYSRAIGIEIPGSLSGSKFNTLSMVLGAGRSGEKTIARQMYLPASDSDSSSKFSGRLALPLTALELRTSPFGPIHCTITTACRRSGEFLTMQRGEKGFPTTGLSGGMVMSISDGGSPAKL